MSLGELPMKVTDSPAFKAWFRKSKVVDARGKPLVVYHGAQRSNRIGNRFRKSRATSGPMAYFTDNPEVASNYATGKQDTSYERPDSYAGWFKMKVGRSMVTIDRAWYFLTSAQQAEIAAKLPAVAYPDDGSARDGVYFLDPSGYGVVGKSDWEWRLREQRGNVLKAAVDVWLDSGLLFDEEELFLKVLELGGAKGLFTYEDPWATSSGVYAVYLSIQNPLVTDKVSEEVLAALTTAAGRSRAVAPKDRDGWDKTSLRSPHEWVTTLRKDLAEGANSYVWTTVPDWVTRALQRLGYDGIHDTGNKSGVGVGEHSVWIPFEETQVKSAIGNRGTFDPNDKNILHGLGSAGRWMRTPGGR